MMTASLFLDRSLLENSSFSGMCTSGRWARKDHAPIGGLADPGLAADLTHRCAFLVLAQNKGNLRLAKLRSAVGVEMKRLRQLEEESGKLIADLSLDKEAPLDVEFTLWMGSRCHCIEEAMLVCPCRRAVARLMIL